VEAIERRIYLARGHKVMLDSDLARLYDVPTKALNLLSGNIAHKLLMRIGGCEAIGPILMDLSQPVDALQRGCEVNDIVNVAPIAVVDAQEATAKPRAPAPQPQPLR